MYKKTTSNEVVFLPLVLIQLNTYYEKNYTNSSPCFFQYQLQLRW